MNRKKNQEKTGIAHKLGNTAGIILCVILLPILLINLTLIFHSFTRQDEVPSVGGVFPLIVLTDSMAPDIQSGDLIICHTEKPENIEAGDVIAFFDPAGNGSSIVTHSVVEVTEVNGKTAWRTRGIANNTDDAMAVTEDRLVGVYRFCIPGLGKVVLFMQSTAGMILCVVCPILLLIVWDFFRRRKEEKDKQEETEALRRELEELREQKAKRTESEQKSEL